MNIRAYYAYVNGILGRCDLYCNWIAVFVSFYIFMPIATKNPAQLASNCAQSVSYVSYAYHRSFKHSYVLKTLIKRAQVSWIYFYDCKKLNREEISYQSFFT